MWSPFVLTVNSSSCASDKITLGRRLVPYPVPNTMLSHRKRARLDNLTEEEKIIRRKILNREAAQKARDRKKDLMENMEENLAQLRWENEYLRSSNRMLRLKFIEQEQKFQALQEKLSGIIKHVELFSGSQIEPLESAELLPQQKGVALCLSVLILLHNCVNWHMSRTPMSTMCLKIYHQPYLMPRPSRCRPRIFLKPKSQETAIALTT
uniref:X-box-binding protein 1 n=1 Tax=Schistosoma japonicum TaxID=6182 RepID=Q5DFK2_SCHJA|nr:SJCHGC06026 protein [Schistosoma japonicum]CAX73403.1 Basic-leucine zipper (bZIP) transcription factor,domain-containing protein [Schistosoma japonicum]